MLNVLIVDDSSVMRSMIAKTLRLSGIPLGELFEGGDGAEGLRMLEMHWIDLALIDIHMPVMDGEEMIRRIREAGPLGRDLPVILVTSERDRERVNPLLRHKTMVVRKPFTPEALRDAILKMTGAGHAIQD